MTATRVLFLVALLVSVSLFATAQTWPAKMAVIGDSISRAALADDTLDDDQPEHSWSTGTASDTCLSHFERIRASYPSIVGYNNAHNGAESDDLLGQANTTVSQGNNYVTIEMGGNDVCGDSTADMTPIAEYETLFNQAIDVLQAGLPGADILVCEVVNVRRVYDVGRYDLWCQLKWNTFGWCDNMLTNGSTQRSEATARNVAYNNSLRTLCAAQGVWFDDDVYEVAFSKGQLSEIDCFHPSTDVQGMLANVTYDASRF